MISKFSFNFVILVFSVFPNNEPITGINIKAENSDEIKTRLTINGIHFINSPEKPGHNIKGRKAANVVAVDAFPVKAPVTFPIKSPLLAIYDTSDEFLLNCTTLFDDESLTIYHLFEWYCILPAPPGLPVQFEVAEDKIEEFVMLIAPWPPVKEITPEAVSAALLLKNAELSIPSRVVALPPSADVI